MKNGTPDDTDDNIFRVEVFEDVRAVVCVRPYSRQHSVQFYLKIRCLCLNQNFSHQQLDGLIDEQDVSGIYD